MTTSVKIPTKNAYYRASQVSAFQEYIIYNIFNGMTICPGSRLMPISVRICQNVLDMSSRQLVLPCSMKFQKNPIP